MEIEKAPSTDDTPEESVVVGILKNYLKHSLKWDILTIFGLSVVWYSISVSFTFYNKWLLQQYSPSGSKDASNEGDNAGFHFPITITCLHMLVKFLFTRVYWCFHTITDKRSSEDRNEYNKLPSSSKEEENEESKFLADSDSDDRDFSNEDFVKDDEEEKQTEKDPFQCQPWKVCAFLLFPIGAVTAGIKLNHT